MTDYSASDYTCVNCSKEIVRRNAYTIDCPYCNTKPIVCTECEYNTEKNALDVHISKEHSSVDLS